VNCSFFLCLAACRTQSSAWVTRSRLCVRCVCCCPAFPLVPALGSVTSAIGLPILFGNFPATTAESDFSCSFIGGYDSSPSRHGPTDPVRGPWSIRRSPRFRRDLFLRDEAFDPDRATGPRITAPHVLPSTVINASAPVIFGISWLNPSPHRIVVYASPWSSPSMPQHSLQGGRYPLPRPDFHRQDHASFAWRTIINRFTQQHFYWVLALGSL